MLIRVVGCVRGREATAYPFNNRKFYVSTGGGGDKRNAGGFYCNNATPEVNKPVFCPVGS